MSLFDGLPLDPDELRLTLLRRGVLQQTVTLRDRSGRAYRRRPYWIDHGKGPEGKTCKSCRFLTTVEFSKTYYKCGRQKITHGPGTQIAMRDPACKLYLPDGLDMLTIKSDFEPLQKCL